MEVFASCCESGGRTIENRNSAATFHSTASSPFPLDSAYPCTRPSATNPSERAPQMQRPSRLPHKKEASRFTPGRFGELFVEPSRKILSRK
jgi:hypothetical protein